MYCPYCGKEIGDDFVYCLNCGRKIPFERMEKSRKNSEINETVHQVSQREKKQDNEVHAPSELNRLEVDFRALVKRLPSEALAHFKNADKDVWQVVKAGMPAEETYKRHGWAGPYAVKICGVVYHAYAKEELLAASQVRFLSVWSGGAKKGIRRARRDLVSLRQGTPHRFINLVTFFIVLFGALLAVFSLAYRWGGHF